MLQPSIRGSNRQYKIICPSLSTPFKSFNRYTCNSIHVGSFAIYLSTSPTLGVKVLKRWDWTAHLQLLSNLWTLFAILIGLSCDPRPLSFNQVFQEVPLVHGCPSWLRTLRDIFTRIKNLGIEIMLGQKYGDFLKKSPNFVPRIKLAHFHPNLFKRNQTQFF